eukprot:3165613-Rhodomonas_salina.1
MKAGWEMVVVCGGGRGELGGRAGCRCVEGGRRWFSGDGGCLFWARGSGGQADCSQVQARPAAHGEGE